MLDEEHVREHRDWLLRQAESWEKNGVKSLTEFYRLRAKEWSEVLEEDDGKELLHRVE